MKLQNKKTNKKILILSLIAVLLAGIAVYILLTSGRNNQTLQTESTMQKQDGKSIDSSTEKVDSEDKVNNNDSTTHEKEKPTIPTYEGEDVNKQQSLSGTINYAEVVETNLVIRTTINQNISAGSCKLALSNGVKTVTKNANIIQNPSSSTCEGFDVPVSELGGGDWKISIAITSGDKSGTLTGTVKI